MVLKKLEIFRFYADGQFYIVAKSGVSIIHKELIKCVIEAHENNI